jgi:hypothetical protein
MSHPGFYVERVGSLVVHAFGSKPLASIGDALMVG